MLDSLEADFETALNNSRTSVAGDTRIGRIASECAVALAEPVFGFY